MGAKENKGKLFTLRAGIRSLLLFMIPLIGRLYGGLSGNCFWFVLATSIFVFGLMFSRGSRLGRFPFPYILLLFWFSQCLIWFCVDSLFTTYENPIPVWKAPTNNDPLNPGFLAVATMSIVLPCANEAEFAVKTVGSIVETVPSSILHEIIVVDDGSNPPLYSIFNEESHKEMLTSGQLKFIRHDSHTGLINAKRVGGNAASGDIITFLDCHVKPADNWYHGIINRMIGNYKRVVVPMITALDVRTWSELPRNGGGLAKCYLTWDADFKWFDSKDQYVPVMSGGLLSISRRWWEETKGYDAAMTGWGGENIDQSVRIWLCGGEIVQANDAFVAHMWRDGNKPETHVKYTIPFNSATTNRYRAGAAWFGPFKRKLDEFPMYSSVSKQNIDISGITTVNKDLNCKPFAWFLKRFKGVYFDGGLLPDKVFHLRDEFSGLCLERHDDDIIHLNECQQTSSGQIWHRANQNKDGLCCSGFRNWNSDQCIGGSNGRATKSTTCKVDGGWTEQHWMLENGQLSNSNKCIGFETPPGPPIKLSTCNAANTFVKESTETEGSFRIVFQQSGQAKLCISLVNSGYQLQPCTESSYQIYHLVQDTGVRNAETDMCMDAGGGSLIAYRCHGDDIGETQQFSFTALSVGKLQLKHISGKCVIAQVDLQKAAKAALGDCKHGLTSQSFSVVNNDPQRTLIQDNTGKCLLSSGSIGVGTGPCSSEESFWSMSEGSIKNNKSGKCLDHDGNQLALSPCLNSGSQIWKVTEGHIVSSSDLCLDASPYKSGPVQTIACSMAKGRHSFSEHWVHVPIERQVYTEEEAKYSDLLSFEA